MSFGGGIGEIPSAEMALALRRREPHEGGCVLGRGECEICWPCRRERAREARRERVERFKARLRLRRQLDAGK